jgi:hypothetical protein
MRYLDTLRIGLLFIALLVGEEIGAPPRVAESRRQEVSLAPQRGPIARAAIGAIDGRATATSSQGIVPASARPPSVRA